MSYAVAKVLNITELVEDILVHVDHRTLIHKRLFLAPQTSISAHQVKNYENVLVPHVQLNPLLFDTPEDESSRKSSLLYCNIFDPDATAYLIVGGCEDNAVPEFKRSLTMERISPYASCRNMLLFDMPITEVNITVGYQPRPWARFKPGEEDPFRKNWYVVQTTLRNDLGVRFGQILKIIECIGIHGEVEIKCGFRVKMRQIFEGVESFLSRYDHRKGLVLNDEVVDVTSSDKRVVPLEVMVDVEHIGGTRFGMNEDGFVSAGGSKASRTFK